MIVPLHNLSLQYLPIKQEVDQMFVEQAMSGNHLGLQEVAKFENKFSKYIHAEDCAGVSSGTDALRLALRAFDIQPGDEVIVPPYTWVSTAEVILDLGAKPVFVDVDNDFLIDIDQIEEKITTKTKCIIHVDLYGQCSDIDRIKLIALKHNLWVLQDSAQSVGTTYNGNVVGSQSHLTCYSYGPVKNLSCMAKAGSVAGRKDLIEKVKLLRNHGFSPDRSQVIDHGYNARMEEFSARLLSKKLDFLNEYNQFKRKIAKIYDQELKDLVETPVEKQHAQHIYYLYTIKTEQRDQLKTHLKTNQIQADVKYAYSLNQQKPFFPYQSCPNAERLINVNISLPCFYGITESQQQYVIDKIKDFFI